MSTPKQGNGSNVVRLPTRKMDGQTAALLPLFPEDHPVTIRFLADARKKAEEPIVLLVRPKHIGHGTGCVEFTFVQAPVVESKSLTEDELTNAQEVNSFLKKLFSAGWVPGIDPFEMYGRFIHTKRGEIKRNALDLLRQIFIEELEEVPDMLHVVLDAIDAKRYAYINLLA